LPWDESDPNSGMFAAPDKSRDSITGLYRPAWAHADATIEELPLGAAGHVPWWSAGRHAGHADIIRELIDGGRPDGRPLAAKIIVRGNPIPQPQPDPARYMALANEIIALWKGPQIAETVIEGQLE
jgi:hypothetical protein